MINSSANDNISLIEPIREELTTYEGFSSVTVSLGGYRCTPPGPISLKLVLAINLQNPPVTWKQDISCIVIELDGWQLEGIEVPSIRASMNEGYFIKSLFTFSKINGN